jgi:hypothetical protein
MYPNQYQPEPFGIRDIRITNVVTSLPTLAEKLRMNEIDVHPSNAVDYPWGIEKMSRLIEAILLKIPLPVFYFDVSNPIFWYSIDGIQRLRTIKSFMENGFLLQNMEILTHLNNMNYFNLENSYKRILYDTQIITYQIEAQTPLELRELIFKKIRDMNEN